MKILLVGEQPSREEDRRGEYGYGEEFDFLKGVLADWGLNIFKDFYYTTAINCAPSKTRQPYAKEVQACSSRLKKLIEKLNVNSIILLGNHATESLIRPRLSGRINGLATSAFMGTHIPDQGYGAYLSPIWGIGELLEKRKYDDGNESKPKYERDKGFYRLWKKAFAEAIDLPSPIIADYRDSCISIEDEGKAIQILKDALDWEKVAFDYETTGIKPHRDGQHIRTVAISDGAFAYAFPFFSSPEFQDSWKALMTSKVKKTVQNLPYEMAWTYVKCGYWIKNWYWDTMIAQHCIANQKPTSLKYMVYTHFGHAGYDDEVDAYLKPIKAEEDRYGGNAINRIDSAPLDKLLLYNALDALYTYKIAEAQQAALSPDQMRGFEFFMESEQTLTKMTEAGFNIDLRKHKEVSDKLDTLMVEQEKKIRSNEVLKQWPDGEFNHQSGPQLSKLLYEILKIEPTAFTDSGKPSVDEEALSNIDLPIIHDILEYRKLAKLKKTYISQYAVEAWDGKMHPSFNLNRVDTFRSCVAKGSKVMVVRDFVESPDGVPIEEVRVGDYVYTYDDSLNLAIRKVVWAGKTGHRNVVRIHYRGGQHHSKQLYLDVTPEHLVRTIEGDYVEAQSLLEDRRDRTQPKWRYLPKSRVLSVARVGARLFPTNRPEIHEHRMVYEFFSGESLTVDDVIHHKNGNHFDHRFENLEKTDVVGHSAIHYPQMLGTVESRAKNVEVVKRNWANGHYPIRRWVDASNALCLTRTQCLRVFIEGRGILGKLKHDYSTYLRWCEWNQIDIHKHHIRFNSKHEYISRWKLAKAMTHGVNKAQRILGVGRYKLKELCDYYGIDTAPYFRGSRYTISPWKDVALNNHQIIKIEWLNEAVDVYDLEVEETHNFIANEICVHNSSSNVNIQNQPKRDKDAKKLIRSFIRPSKGNKLVEFDYKSLEVVLNSVYSQDPTLMKYILDSSTDMHRDASADCFLLKPEEVTKAIRNDVKGQFVFAEFYGSYYKQVAVDLWETAHKHNLVDHLKDKGIKNFTDFERHIQEAERILWEDRFPVHNEWREAQWKFYQKKGYVELLTGFRCYGPMKKNNTFNSPVQGTGYHCLQYTLNQVNKKVQKLERTRLIGEIHDSCIADVHPSEEHLLDYWYWYYGTQKIREDWPWLNLPLTVEKEQSEIDGTWAEMTEAGTLKGE